MTRFVSPLVKKVPDFPPFLQANSPHLKKRNLLKQSTKFVIKCYINSHYKLQIVLSPFTLTPKPKINMNLKSGKSIQLICLAFLCTIFSQALMFIKADDELIARLCSATSYPNTCSNCLNSDPSSKTATDTGLVRISMLCAANDMNTLFQDTFIYQGNTTESTMKDALNYCLNQFEDAENKINNVSDEVQRRDFDGAKQRINDEILAEVVSCTNFLHSKGLPVPEIVSNDIDTVDRDWNIVMEILGSLKS